MESRTGRQVKEEVRSRGSASHSGSCGYPSEPCNCAAHNKSERRRSHSGGCNYPNDPCSCGLYGGG